MVMTADSTWTFKGLVVARRNETQECAAYEFSGAIEYEDTGFGTCALLATVTPTGLGDASATWSLGVTADDTNKSLKLEVTAGAASGSVRWVAYVQTVQVTNATVYY